MYVGLIYGNQYNNLQAKLDFSTHLKTLTKGKSISTALHKQVLARRKWQVRYYKLFESYSNVLTQGRKLIYTLHLLALEQYLSFSVV